MKPEPSLPVGVQYFNPTPPNAEDTDFLLSADYHTGSTMALFPCMKLVICTYCYEWFSLYGAWDKLGEFYACPKCQIVGIIDYTNEQDDENIIDFSLVKIDITNEDLYNKIESE